MVLKNVSWLADLLSVKARPVGSEGRDVHSGPDRDRDRRPLGTSASSDHSYFTAEEERRWRSDQDSDSSRLRKSDLLSLLNESWYNKTYPDVAAAAMDPLQHYLRHGHAELRDPSPDFSTRWYLEHNPWVSREDGNGLAHFVLRRDKENRPRAALFGYSWSDTGRLDPYMKEIALSLARLGLNVDVYLGNDYSGHNGVKGLKSKSYESKIAQWLAKEDYSVAISFNNSLIMPKVIDSLGCKIVSVIVDSRNHLFDHLDGSGKDIFSLDFVVAPIYTSLANDLKAAIPDSGERVMFFPPATSPDRPPRAERPADKLDTIPISWIASLVGDHLLDDFMKMARGSPELIEALRVCVAQVEATGQLTLKGSVSAAAHTLASTACWDIDYLELQIQNVVTNTKRIAVVERLAPLGLHLYGNERWTNLFPYNTAITQAFRGTGSLRSHSDLMQIYNRSRLCINLPQAQATSGMQYRVIDVMASNGLLITERRPESDLDVVFGIENPIVRYNSLEDLTQKCRYYLENESERLALVARCNQLVSTGYSFSERVEQYATLSNPGFVTKYTARHSVRQTPGSVALVKGSTLIAATTST